MIVSGDFHKRRAIFASLNPGLREEPSQYHCRELWHLLTPRHRHGLPSCDPGPAQAWESECFLNNSEAWRDTLTGLPVMVMHLDCKHHGGDQVHERPLSVLAERGLWYTTANSSWVIKRAMVVVIARADIINRITLLNHLANSDDLKEIDAEPHWLPMTRRPAIDWKKRQASRLAEERVVRNNKAILASEAESRGDYQAALEYYCETAYIDRTGGYHKTAQDQLFRARAVIEAHSDLDVDTLRFENIGDREYVFHNARTMVSCSHLEQRLSPVPLPPYWEPFDAQDSWMAHSRINGQGRDGEVCVDQDGNGYLWKATVSLNNGFPISTVAGGETQIFPTEADYCCESPESAVAAAIRIYHNYGRLLIKEGVPLAEVVEISGAFGEIQSAD